MEKNKDLMNWIVENFDWIILLIIGIIEVILRYVPSAENWSIIDGIHKILTFLFPENKAKIRGTQVIGVHKV